jgi:hypothetical protein
MTGWVAAVSPDTRLARHVHYEDGGVQHDEPQQSFCLVASV